MLQLTAFPQEARVDRQGGVAVRVVTLGVVVVMSILLVRQDVSVAGRDVSFNSFACPRFNPARALPVALEELRAHPVRYQGRAVKVRGAYVDGWEMSALHPGPPVRDPWAADGIWVEGIAPMTLPTEQAVEMTGIVSAARPDAQSGKGHLGKWPAELCVSSVRRLQE
ncbi:hypothetical protein [Stenotrophomonas lactitubi]|uniref:hypothetical protein n=1 Tax=Stenotrophomonas lactitubi TaxID=2045214 RepID=UPI0010563049|nr:hypothetical protein [Stenotrophomonas lactitubi]